MRTPSTIAAVPLMFILWMTCASAQQIPPSPVFIDAATGVTLEQLLRTAESREPGLRASALAAEALKEDVRQASLRANPRVSIEQREEIGGMDRQTTAMAEWPLELFRRSTRVAVARADANVASENVRNAERLLAQDVHMAYTRYLAAARTVAIFDQLAEQSRTMVQLLESRAAAGAIPRLERDQASVEEGRVQAGRLAAIGAAERARIEVQRAAGLAPRPDFTIAETLESAASLSDVDMLLSMSAESAAVASRADVRAADAQVIAENARRVDAQARGRADISIFGGYMRMVGGFPQNGFNASGAIVPIEGVFHNVAAGIMIDVPLFDRKQGAVAAAALRVSAAKQQADGRRLAAGAELEIARARLRAARAAARVFSRELRETARRNVEVVREAYSLGRNTLLDVVTEQKRYLDVEMAYTDALMELLDAHAALLAAAGR